MYRILMSVTSITTIALCFPLSAVGQPMNKGYCDTCETCTAMLNDATYDEVAPTADLIADGTCIFIERDGARLDCENTMTYSKTEPMEYTSPVNQVHIASATSWITTTSFTTTAATRCSWTSTRRTAKS